MKGLRVLSLFDGISSGHIALERAGIPVECERLQTLPDNYTDCISNLQRYKAIGNGWTVDVIAHIFSYLKEAEDVDI